MSFQGFQTNAAPAAPPQNAAAADPWGGQPAAPQTQGGWGAAPAQQQQAPAQQQQAPAQGGWGAAPAQQQAPAPAPAQGGWGAAPTQQQQAPAQGGAPQGDAPQPITPKGSGFAFDLGQHSGDGDKFEPKEHNQHLLVLKMHAVRTVNTRRGPAEAVFTDIISFAPDGQNYQVLHNSQIYNKYVVNMCKNILEAGQDSCIGVFFEDFSRQSPGNSAPYVLENINWEQQPALASAAINMVFPTMEKEGFAAPGSLESAKAQLATFAAGATQG